MKTNLQEKLHYHGLIELKGVFMRNDFKTSSRVPINNFFTYFSIGIIIIPGGKLTLQGFVAIKRFCILSVFSTICNVEQITKFLANIQRAVVGGRHQFVQAAIHVFFFLGARFFFFLLVTRSVYILG